MIILCYFFSFLCAQNFDDFLFNKHGCLKNRSSTEFSLQKTFKHDFEKEVYKAEEKKTKKVLLLKGINLLAPAYAVSELEGLQALAGKLFMPAYYECFVEKNTLFVVEEFLGEFEELNSFAKNHKLKEDDILFIVAQISVGLFEMHKVGFMHGDFHRRNVMISKKEPYEIRIIDFDGGKTNSKKCHEFASGSDRNYSPEMCTLQGYTDKGDIWSLGTLTFYLSTLSKPFNGPDQLQNTCAILSLNTSYLPLLGKYSHSLRDLIDWMFTRNQNYRPDIIEVLASPMLVDIVFKKIPTLYEKGSKSAQMLSQLLNEIRAAIDARAALGQIRPVVVLPPQVYPNVAAPCSETYAALPEKILAKYYYNKQSKIVGGRKEGGGRERKWKGGGRENEKREGNKEKNVEMEEGVENKKNDL